MHSTLRRRPLSLPPPLPLPLLPLPLPTRRIVESSTGRGAAAASSAAFIRPPPLPPAAGGAANWKATRAHRRLSGRWTTTPAPTPLLLVPPIPLPTWPFTLPLLPCKATPSAGASVSAKPVRLPRSRRDCSCHDRRRRSGGRRTREDGTARLSPPPSSGAGGGNM